MVEAKPALNKSDIFQVFSMHCFECNLNDYFEKIIRTYF